MTERFVSSVGHVLWSGSAGGIERLVQDLAAEQTRQGLRVVVAFGRAVGPFVDLAATAGAEIIDLRLASGYDIRPMRTLDGARRVHTVQVVHLHGFNPALAAITLAARRPIVFTEHGTFALGRRPRRREHMKRSLQRIFLEHRVAALAANSAHTASRITEIYDIAPDHVRIVHNGTDFASLQTPSNERQNGQLRVAFLGRLVPFKRVDRLIEGVARCAVRDHVRLDIIGAGPLERELKALADSLGLADLVRFLGYRADAGALVADADIIVHPSVGEPFGLAILEACAQGALPIVFADGGGALEVLPPDGIVVKNVEDLAEALELVEGSDALSLAARRARASWTRDNFSIAATAREYAELYEAVATDVP